MFVLLGLQVLEMWSSLGKGRLSVVGLRILGSHGYPPLCFIDVISSLRRLDTPLFFGYGLGLDPVRGLKSGNPFIQLGLS